MKWTDEMIDSFSRTDTINALAIARQVLGEFNELQGRLNAVETSIQATETKASSIKKGNYVIYAIVGGIILYFILRAITHSGIIAFLITAIFIWVGKVVDNKVFANKREQQAEEYRQNSLPPLYQQKTNEEKNIRQFNSSEAVSNVVYFLPQQYLDVQVVEQLISLLQSRRASSLAEAINAYETLKHQQRIEQMQMQQVQAAQAAAQAQQQAANAQVESAGYLKKATKEQIRATRELTGAAQDMSSAAHDMKSAASRLSSANKSSGGSVQQYACPNCGNYVAPTSSKCPHCDCPLGTFGSGSIVGWLLGNSPKKIK